MQTFLITGFANKKSVASFVAKDLIEKGHRVIFSIQKEEILKKLMTVFPDSPYFICDVEKNLEELPVLLKQILGDEKLAGILHSIAFTPFDINRPYFHQTSLEQFQKGAEISAFSLPLIVQQALPYLSEEASIVAISISDLKATSYGFLGPIKAMLESMTHYLAKSLSQVHKKIRVNAVAAGPLKTSASAGIPGYLENYLYAEQMTLRKEGLKTQEVAKASSFLLSKESSGINATTLCVDAGMSVNHFDEELVKAWSQKHLK